jgi:outer membrane receptor protein involved in Fe transport
MYRKWSTLVLVALALPVAAFAQSTGKLSGRVIDAETGEGLPGANVLIVGTQFGTAADFDGNYTILGLPVGEYDVQASFVGFSPQTVTDVEINSGYTRELNFALSAGDILDEIVVEYERPLIQRDALGSPRVVTGDEIQNLPVRGVARIASLQSGVVSDEGDNDLNVRGGRDNDVIYFVDGVKVVGGASALGVPQSAIQEQEMLIGGLPAKYGDAVGGVISVSTRNASTKFFGSVEALTSEALDDFGYNEVEATLGGPILGNKLGFFVSGEYYDIADANPQARGFLQLRDGLLDEIRLAPQSIQYLDSTGATRYRPLPGDLASGTTTASLVDPDMGETFVDIVNRTDILEEDDFETSASKINDYSRGYTLTGKFNLQPVNAIRVAVGGTYADRDFRDYDRLSGLFNPDRAQQEDRETRRGFVTMTHYLSDRTFYQVQASYEDYRAWSYNPAFSRDVEDVFNYSDIDNPINAVAARYKTIVQRDEDLGGPFIRQQFADNQYPLNVVGRNLYSLPGQRSVGYAKSRTEQLRFQFNATTQLGIHQIEFGGEYEQRTQRAFSISESGVQRIAGFAAGDTRQELGADTISAYSEVSYPAIVNNINYYGYDFRGINEVDSENLAAFAATNPSDEDLNIAPVEPIYYAGYLQNKIEYRDLVVQIGARIDVYDANQRVLRDQFALVPVVRASDIADAPASVGDDFAVYYNGDDITGFRDLAGRFYDANGQELAPGRTPQGRARAANEELGSSTLQEGAFEDYEPDVTFQPRVGVTFPITDQALFFAHYDVLAQRPSVNFIETLQDYQLRLGDPGTLGNPNLKPERVTEYEAGFRQRLGENAAIQISGFFRQIDDLIQLRALKNVFPNNYSTYQNVDFGTVKGVEVEFDLRRFNNVSMNANYTLSFAEGTGSDASTTSRIFWLREANPFVPNFLSPLDFDRRHTANVTLDYRLGDGDGPEIAGTRLLENFGFNILASFKSGKPYSRYLDPFPVDQQVRQSGLAGQINGSNLPASFLLNLKVDRRFSVGPADMTAFLEVENLLDADNVTNVWQATGSANTDGYLESPDGLQDFPRGTIDRFYYRNRIASPYNYGIPRQTRLGLRLNF